MDFQIIGSRQQSVGGVAGGWPTRTAPLSGKRAPPFISVCTIDGDCRAQCPGRRHRGIGEPTCGDSDALHQILRQHQCGAVMITAGIQRQRGQRAFADAGPHVRGRQRSHIVRFHSTRTGFDVGQQQQRFTIHAGDAKSGAKQRQRFFAGQYFVFSGW